MIILLTPVLFLAHRIPFPPNKGDKIRSYHLMEQLARHHEVHLGAFVDDPSDWQHQAELKNWCAETFLRPLKPTVQRLSSLRGLATRVPLTLPYYRDRKMAEWVKQKCTSAGIDRVVIFSAAMAQYVLGVRSHFQRCIVDLVDVDSEKWREYGPRHRWPMNWIYAREATLLLRYERMLAQQCDATVLVSSQEAQLFRELAPESADRVYSIHNGVDAEYFSPGHVFPTPYAPGAQILVFTGAMDYWANADAVVWFAEEILPHVRSAMPQVQFYIVGARPSERVKRLGRLDGVTVTGAVADIRPYLAHARAAVAPLRIARGIQNKVLEAMAMVKPVIATTAAMDGIDAPPRLRALLADEPAQFVDRLQQVLKDDDSGEFGRLGRELVLERYAWSESFARFDQLLGSQAGADRRAAQPPTRLASTRGAAQ